MSCHADCRCSAKFHFVQLSGKRRRTRQLARTPFKKLPPIRAIDFKSRRFTHETRNFSVQPWLLPPGRNRQKEHDKQSKEGWCEHPRSPAQPTGRGLGALMGQSRQNPALKGRTLGIGLKCPPDAFIRGCQLLKKSCTFGAVVQMIE